MAVGGEEIVMSNTGHQMRVIGFMKKRIQEQARVKWKQIYLTSLFRERYTPLTEWGLSQKVRGSEFESG